jgi:hypothetical protein
MIAPLEDPSMEGFVSRLEEINQLADTAPGFVWRLQSDSGSATYVRPYEDDRILVNLSVWATIDDLRHYVFETAHGEVMRNRRAWFEKMSEAYSALWWVPVGEIPSVEQAKDRLESLRNNGPTAHAFTFKSVYEP